VYGEEGGKRCGYDGVREVMGGVLFGYRELYEKEEKKDGEQY
jgi:hypothetical protein